MNKWEQMLNEAYDLHRRKIDSDYIPISLNNFARLKRFVDATLAVDNLNMSMAREDMEKRIAEYNLAKKELLG